MGKMHFFEKSKQESVRKQILKSVAFDFLSVI